MSGGRGGIFLFRFFFHLLNPAVESIRRPPTSTNKPYSIDERVTSRRLPAQCSWGHMGCGWWSGLPLTATTSLPCIQEKNTRQTRRPKARNPQATSVKKCIKFQPKNHTFAPAAVKIGLLIRQITVKPETGPSGPTGPAQKTAAVFSQKNRTFSSGKVSACPELGRGGLHSVRRIFEAPPGSLPLSHVIPGRYAGSLLEACSRGPLGQCLRTPGDSHTR